LTGGAVDDMQNLALKEQGRQLTALAQRISDLEAKLAEMVGQLSTFQNIGKAVIIMAAAALGVDLVQMGAV